jgi:hypothetical protein
LVRETATIRAACPIAVSHAFLVRTKKRKEAAGRRKARGRCRANDIRELMLPDRNPASTMDKPRPIAAPTVKTALTAIPLAR